MSQSPDDPNGRPLEELQEQETQSAVVDAIATNQN